MTSLPLLLMGAGTILDATSQIREGKQISANEIYNAQVAESQIKTVRASAAFERETLTQQSDIELAKISRAKKRTLSTQKAQFAKGGIRTDEGSPLKVMADSAAQFELDMATVKYNLATGKEIIRFEEETDISRLKSESIYRRRLAKSSRRSSLFKAGSTILTGASRIGMLMPKTGGEDLTKLFSKQMAPGLPGY